MKDQFTPASEPVAWANLDLHAMAEAFSRCIEAQYASASPFQCPINMDAMIALRAFRHIIPSMLRIAEALQKERDPETIEVLSCTKEQP